MKNSGLRLKVEKLPNTKKQSKPVRSFAKSGWFMRQWLANFTHSSLTGTWMSLNLETKIQLHIIHLIRH